MAAKKRTTGTAPVDPLRNWQGLNAALMALPEAEVAALLEREKAGANRLTFTLRIHARLSRLRRERERRDLAGRAS